MPRHEVRERDQKVVLYHSGFDLERKVLPREVESRKGGELG